MGGATEGAKSGGALGLIVATVVLCGIGAGSGAALTMFVLKPELAAGTLSSETSPAATKPAAAPKANGYGGPAVKPEASVAKARKIVEMEPIHTSLAGASKTWVRLEAAIVYSGETKEDRAVLTRQIAQDALVYLRSLTLEQIDSASGLEFLREDLSEIAALRTKGAAREVLLKTLMVE